MGQLRRKIRALSAQTRMGDTDAAGKLLNHSVQFRHGRLAVRRFFLAKEMGAFIHGDDERYCLSLINKMPAVLLQEIIVDSRRKARKYLCGGSSVD